MTNEQGITKADLDAALTAFGANLSEWLTRMFRSEMHQMRDDLRGEMHQIKDVLRTEMHLMKDDLTEQSRQIETNLLTEFHRYAKGQQSRMHSLEVNDSDIRIRLATIEERLLALESRRPPSF